MKRFVLVSGLISMVALLLISGAAYLHATSTGNGGISGPHFDLNLVGVSSKNVKNAYNDNLEGHVIFTALISDQKNGDPDTLATDTDPILLVQGPDFEVCQRYAWATPVACPDTTFIGTFPAAGAVFELPCNNLSSLGLITPCTSSGPGSIAEYTVWARALSKPTSGSTITLCGQDTATGTTYCNTDVMFLKNRPSKFTDVTSALTSLVVSTNCGKAGQPACGTYPLFATGFENFYWDYDNAGNKLVQLRFYLE